MPHSRKRILVIAGTAAGIVVLAAFAVLVLVGRSRPPGAGAPWGMDFLPGWTVTDLDGPLAVLDIRETALGFLSVPTDSTNVLAEPSTPLPAYFATFPDTTFGTQIVRIAGGVGAAIGGGVPGTWGADARHHYSKDQPWNSDGTLLALQNNASGMVLLDGETYQPRLGKCSNYSIGDDRWHPSPDHPNERINARATELMWFDVVRCVKTRSWPLPHTVEYFGRGEGNPSHDGRFAALTDGARMFVVDMDPQPPLAPYPNSRIGPSVSIDECGLATGCEVDWVSISPSGKYAVVSYDGDFPRVFDVHPTTLALTPRPYAPTSARCAGTAVQGFIYSLGHADMTLDPFDNDEDVIIGQEHCGNRGNLVDGKVMSAVVMVRLRDDAVTPLTQPTNEAQAHHISTRNYDRPGWVYVGYHIQSGKKFSDEIVAVKLDGSASMQRLAFKHGAYSGCYRCESHAVPSRDGRRVLWASNWNFDCTTCGSPTDIKPYIVDARALVPAGSPRVAPYTIVADASRSSDSGSTIASYTFEFGDGMQAGPQLSPFASHTFNAGEWNLKLTVTNVLGVSSTTTRSIHVVSASGPPPTALLSMTPAAGTAPCSVVADASGSSAAGGAIESYRYDFGDGTATTSSNPTMSHVYAAGTWTARVIVTSTSGMADTATSMILVLATPVGRPEDKAVVSAPRVLPNPMLRHGAIAFSTASSGALRAELYDSGGRMVRVLANEALAPSGPRSLEIDGRDQAGAALPAGVYFYRIQSTAGRSRGQFVLIQ